VKRTALLILFVALPSISGPFSQAQPSTEPQDWIPQAIADLAQTASSHTDFSFDHSMLVLASKVDQDDDSFRRIIAGVDGVSVHRYRFQNGVAYNPGVLNAVKAQYHAAGWEHLAGGHRKQNSPNETDLWFRLDHAAIRKIAVLAVGRDQINFITVSGSISPLDLLHLSGHFGIPPIQGGVAVPNASQQQNLQPPGY